MNYKIIWEKTLNNIKSIVDPLAFDTWFKNIYLYKFDGGSAIIVIPIMWYKMHINQNYKDIIIENLNLFSTTIVENLSYVLKSDIKENVEQKVSLDNIEVLDVNNSFKSNLRKNYTFDNFVVGESNKFAQAAALAVCENPGTMYNPLFIYGNSGLGKTHLMHAIGNYISSHSSNKVLYVTSDEFMNDFTGLVRKSPKDNNLDYTRFFKDKYRNIDVLIIDDIQFLGGASASQQEFFHTFNNLYNDSKQIIVSSDRSPNDLKVLEDRLRTRFCWGLQVDISPPDFELKVLIIRKKIKGEKVVLSDDIVNYIAANVGNDVRQLEGAINRVIAYSVIMGINTLTLEFAIEALKDYTKKGGVSDQNDIRRIQKTVANFYKISFDDMRSKKRTPSLAIPRQVGMYLSRKLTNESFERIGIEFGGKNHATVIHSCNKIENELKINNNLINAINDIEKQLT